MAATGQALTPTCCSSVWVAAVGQPASACRNVAAGAATSAADSPVTAGESAQSDGAADRAAAVTNAVCASGDDAQQQTADVQQHISKGHGHQG